MSQEKFNNMIFDYYFENSDYDFYNEDDAVNIVADFSERCARFLVDFISEDFDDDDNAVYRLTPLGMAIAQSIKREKIMRHDELIDKYNSFTISSEELEELKKLKEELK